MDKKEIVEKLQPFILQCKEQGYEFSGVYLRENIVGVPAAGYHLYLKADWINQDSICDDLLDKLMDIYLESIPDIEVKRKVHYFSIKDKFDQLHCWDYPVI